MMMPENLRRVIGAYLAKPKPPKVRPVIDKGPGEYMRSVRLRLDWPQREFAIALGVSTQYVSNMECGRAPVSTRMQNLVERIDALLTVKGK